MQASQLLLLVLETQASMEKSWRKESVEFWVKWVLWLLAD